MRGTVNWAVIDDPQVQSVALKVARSIAGSNQGILEEDDLYQEGMTRIAATAHLNRTASDGDYGLLYTRLRTDLLQATVEKMDRSGELHARKYKTVTTEVAEEVPQTIVMFDEGSGDYTEEAIRLLLPAVWDEAYAYGLPERDNAPEKDMPKAAANKARGNSHWAYIADIKTGWKKTPLTLDERRALVLYFGIGWTQRDIAFNQNVSLSTVNMRLNSGVTKITALLNGASLTEEK